MQEVMTQNTIRQGVLTQNEIQELELVQDADSKCYQTASYDLRLGSCHYVFGKTTEDGHNDSGWSLVHIGSEKEFAELNSLADSTEEVLRYSRSPHGMHILKIPEFGSAIIELKEKVDTYTVAKKHNLLVVGRFDLKLSRVYQALISQQATQVEPLYCGKLYCFVHNLSNQTICLYENEKIATIEFSYAGMALTEDERKELISEKLDKTPEKYMNSKYSDQEKGGGIKEVRWFYANDRLPEECGLHRLYDTVHRSIQDADKKMAMKFEEFVSREETVQKIAANANEHLADRNRTLELGLTGFIAMLSFGVGTIVWELYKELAELRAWKEAICGDVPLDVSDLQCVLPGGPLFVPIIMVILYLIMLVLTYKLFKRRGSLEGPRKNTVRDEQTEADLKRLSIEIEQLWACYDLLPEVCNARKCQMKQIDNADTKTEERREG